VSTEHETILVVEDDIRIRMPIAEYLRECGYTVVEAVDADEAIKVLSRGPMAVDIVFSDIEMPGSVNGFGLAKWVRQNCPGVNVILSGTTPRAVDAATELCEERTVLKPYQPHTVQHNIRRLLSAGKPTPKPSG
jgi:CheY-like chemotaxis protein